MCLLQWTQWSACCGCLSACQQVAAESSFCGPPIRHWLCLQQHHLKSTSYIFEGPSKAPFFQGHAHIGLCSDQIGGCCLCHVSWLLHLCSDDVTTAPRANSDDHHTLVYWQLYRNCVRSLRLPAPPFPISPTNHTSWLQNQKTVEVFFC